MNHNLLDKVIHEFKLINKWRKEEIFDFSIVKKEKSLFYTTTGITCSGKNYQWMLKLWAKV